MPTHTEQKYLPYTPDQLFDLVADVEKYPEFLPWCTACHITGQEKGTKTSPDIVYADLVVGYKFFQEAFTSRVQMTRPDTIVVEYLKGPMRHLSNHWRFTPVQNGAGTMIDFYVDFDFRNPLLRHLMTLFFNEAVRRMVSAFEARAADLYGPKGP